MKGVKGFLEAVFQRFAAETHNHPLLTGFQLGLITAFAYPEYARMLHNVLENAQINPTNEELEQILLEFIKANPIQAIVVEELGDDHPHSGD